MVRSARCAARSGPKPSASRRARRGDNQLSKLACTAARIGSLRGVTSSAVVATGQPRSNPEPSRPSGEQAGERLDGVGHRRLGPQQVRDGGGHLVAGAPDRLGADLLLAAGEVVIERAARRAAALQHLVHPGAVVALALQKLDGGVQQSIAAWGHHL